HLSLASTGPPPTELYALSLHDALPISAHAVPRRAGRRLRQLGGVVLTTPGGPPGQHISWIFVRCPLRPSISVTKSVTGYGGTWRDRKSTRLNSSHGSISYAVFCLKKKK